MENRYARGWALAALAVAIGLAVLPDPSPMAAPAWAIKGVRSLLGLQEAGARVIASIALRLTAIGVLGALLMLATKERRFTGRSMLMLVLAPVIAILTLWIDRGYFPLPSQLKLALLASAAGALAGLVLRRNLIAALALVVLLGGAYWMLTNYSIDDDLDAATRDQVKHMLAGAEQLPEGDAGFLALITNVFDRAAQHSVSADPVLENKAAILALAVVIGDEKLAGLADRTIDKSVLPACEQLRSRMTIYDRPDWARHFCVSAGLTVLANGSRSLTVGLLKELKDANAGGSGFSFGDLTADGSGDRFAFASTRDVSSALAMQQRVKAGVAQADLMPDVRDLPEGITVENFQNIYGGVKGRLTDSLVTVIEQRLGTCAALR